MKNTIFTPSRLFTVLSVVTLASAAAGCSGSTQTIPTSLPQTARLSPAAQATDTPIQLPQSTASLASPIQAAGSSVPFRSLRRGFRLGSGLPGPGLLLAVDDKSLAAVASLIDENDRSLLQGLDLNKQALLAAFWGVKPSGGCSITIQDIRLSGDEPIVDVLLQEVDPAFPRIEAATSPYHLVVIDKAILKGSNLRYRLVSGDAFLASGILP